MVMVTVAHAAAGTQCLFTSNPWVLTLESNIEQCIEAFNITGEQVPL